MQSDDPAFLPVGTEVSAKFKGAFCEAKVKKVTRNVRCKVVLKESPFGTTLVEDANIAKGSILEVNQIIEITQNRQVIKAQILHVKDCSQYHVVFNDGDEKTLRRTQMCLKGAKHFDSAVNLDALPLYNPEQFGFPLHKGQPGGSKDKKRKFLRRKTEESPSKKSRKNDDGSEDEKETRRREKRAAASAATVAIGEMDQGDTEQSGYESSRNSSEEKEKEKEKEKAKEKEKERKEKESRKSGPSDKEGEVKTKKKDKIRYKVGTLVCAFTDETYAAKVRDIHTNVSPQSSSVSSAFKAAYWYPAVVVSLKAFLDNAPKKLTIGEGEITLRRFNTGSTYLSLSPGRLVPFDYFPLTLMDTWESMRPDLRISVELVIQFQKSSTLPNGWNKKQIFAGEEIQSTPKKEKERKEKDKELPKKKEKPEKERRTRESESDKDREKDKDKEKKRDKEKIKEKEKEKDKTKDKEKEREKEKQKEKTTVDREKDEKTKEKEKEKEKEREKEKEKEKKRQMSESTTSSSESEEEPLEKRDVFIAQLYKFHEERASPINKGPILGGKEIDLYQFQRYVDHYGGAKKVTENGHWRKIKDRMGLDGCPGATPVTVRKAYQRYLEPYTNFCKEYFGDTPPALISTSRGERRLQRFGAISEDKNKIKRRKSTAGETSKDLKTSKGDDDVGRASVESTGVRSSKQRSETPSSSSVPPADPPASVPDKVPEVDEQLPGSSRRYSIHSPPLKSDERKTNDSEAPVESKKRHSDAAAIPKEKRERRHTLSESRKEKEKEKNEESSDAEPDAKKRKEKRKISIREKSERRTTNGPSDGDIAVSNTDDSCCPAHLFSHFFLGQKVRAMHTDRWYDARLVEFRKASTEEIAAVMNKFPAASQSVPPEPLAQLQKISSQVELYVHYLGWNSRYDEWIPLSKIRVSDKDKNLSMEKLKTLLDRNYWTDERLSTVQRWLEPHALAKRPPSQAAQSSALGLSDDEMASAGEEAAPSTSYRSRRISYSQSDSSNADTSRKDHKSTVQGTPLVSPVTSPAAVMKQKTPTPSELPPPTSTSTKTIVLSSPSASRATPVAAAKNSMISSFVHYPQTSVQTGLLKSGQLPSHFIQKMGSPELTVRAVAAAAVGLDSRGRSSRSPMNVIRSPGGRVTSSATVTATVNAALTNAPIATEVTSSVNFSTTTTTTTVATVIRKTPASIASPPAPPTKTLSPAAQKEDVKEVRTRTPSPKKIHPHVFVSAIETPPKSGALVIQPAVSETKSVSEPKKKHEKDVAKPPPEPEVVKKDEYEFVDDDEEIKKSEPKEERKIDTILPPRQLTPTTTTTTTPATLERSDRRKTRAQSRVAKDVKESSSDDADADADDEEERELELEKEAKRVCEATIFEDSDVASGSETPQRTDGEENEKIAESTPANEEERRSVAPGRYLRGSGKRKRASHNRHSAMVVEKKYQKSKPKAEEKQRDDDSDFECPVSDKTDSYQALRQRLLKEWEADGTYAEVCRRHEENLDKLEIETPNELLLDAYEQYCMTIRDRYYELKAACAKIDRGHRKRQERERERKRAERRNEAQPLSPKTQAVDAPAPSPAAPATVPATL
ncbi:unnamed protein product [Caenorhabditis auriculariae]|uniref:ARID domain-containing protein n=1 Tax=Caenorhabditis auriculariae TaxID=2777116 RepID=A0A8S1HS37_9PELO|nr:unnamed protein product [Caenorhabditis auriculariae]